MWNQDTDVSSNAAAFEGKGYRTPHFEQLGVNIYIYIYMCICIYIYIYTCVCVYQIYRIIKL